MIYYTGITHFIPLNERNEQKALINQIGNVVFGTIESAKFAEEFIPEGGRLPSPKSQNFSKFLINYPTCLWAVYTDMTKSALAGFILISNLPHDNAIGFGLNPEFKGKGLMSRAWEEIKTNECVKFPLNAYTSVRNKGAISFLEKNGFNFKENINFIGEDSVHYLFTNN